MRVDTHVHTFHSGPSGLYPLSLFLRESYNTPENVYRVARRRGMDLVAITDHDTVSGALTIAHRPDVIVGCEVTAVFPSDGVRVHLNVLDVTEAQHREIDRLRFDVRELLPYLRQQGIFTSLNHVASRINGRITASHIAAIVPWIDAFEVRNGSRLASQNQTALSLAESCGKTTVGGSDSHTLRGIGRTWIEIDGVSSRGQFMDGLRAGRARVGGRQGHFFTMASDIMRITGRFYEEQARNVFERPLRWKRHLALYAATASLPVVVIPLVSAFVHFLLEDRFNRQLLLDLASRPVLRAQGIA